MECANENCSNKIDTSSALLVTADGDFVCNEKCKKEFEDQREEFFKNIGNDDWFNKWLFG